MHGVVLTLLVVDEAVHVGSQVLGRLRPREIRRVRLEHLHGRCFPLTGRMHEGTKRQESAAKRDVEREGDMRLPVTIDSNERSVINSFVGRPETATPGGLNNVRASNVRFQPCINANE